MGHLPPAPLTPVDCVPETPRPRPGSSASPLHPTDPFRIAACLAAGLSLAAGALACSGSPFAPPTSTPTATATATPSPTPTHTATPSPTPSATPAPKVYTEDRSDGSTRVVDAEKGYAFTVPTRWLVIPLSGQDSADLMGAVATQYPDFAPLIEASASPGMRVMGVDLDPAHMEGREGPVLNVGLQEDMPDIPLELFLSLYTGMVPQIIPGASVTDTHLVETSHGIPVGIVDLDLTLRDAAGAAQRVRIRQAIFLAGDVLVELNLEAPVSHFDELEPTFSQIIDSIEVTSG